MTRQKKPQPSLEARIALEESKQDLLEVRELRRNLRLAVQRSLRGEQ